MKALLAWAEPYLWLIKWIAAGVVVAGLWIAVERHDAAQQKIGYDKAAAIYQAKLDKAKAEARSKEQSWNKQWQGAINDRTKLETQLADARAAAAAADVGLRNASADFRRRLSAASVEACRTAAATAASLLEECSGEYRRVAAAADGHLADLKQCEAAWPE